MDELKNRRKQLSDPESTIQELKARTDLTQSEQEQLLQLESFESEIRSALDVQVPENLAEKILLNNAMDNPKTGWFSTKRFMTMAASFAIVSFISLRLFLLTPSTAMADDALSHVYHDIQNLSENQPDAQDKMLRAMKAVGITHEVILKNISYAANCMVGKRAGVHLVVTINSETYTVLLLPKAKVDKNEAFSDENFHGEIVAMNQGALIVIAMKDTQLDIAVSQLLLKFNQSQNS
jgi:hypothetical protein